MAAHTSSGAPDNASLVVRSAEPGDRDGVERLFAEGHPRAGWSPPPSGFDNFARAAADNAVHVAVEESQVVGASWLYEGDDGPDLRFAFQHEAAHGAIPRMLFAAAAERARERGIRQMHTTVTLEDPCALVALREAGLRITSAFSVGGVTRLSLALV